MAVSKQARTNAIKNVLLGNISIKGSILAKHDINALKIASSAFLYNGGSLEESETLRQILMQTIRTRKFKNRKLVEEVFDIIISLHNEGKKLRFTPFRLRIKHNETMHQAFDTDAKRREDAKLREVVEQSRTAMADFINQLIVEQKQASDDYYANYKPYKQTHERRFDFDVKNQKKTTESFNEEVQEIYGENLICRNYVNSKTLAQMYCCKHDHSFTRMPGHLLKGYGCPRCNKEEGKTWKNTVEAQWDPSRKSTPWTNERFIQESVNRFGEGVFDYSKLNYINNDTHIILIRVRDGKEIKVLPYEHLRHDEHYDGEKKYYEGKTNEEKIHHIVRKMHECCEHKVYMPYQDIPDSARILRFICPWHGEFNSTMAKIRLGKCCAECDGLGESTGERMVRKYLIAKKIDYRPQFYIKDEDYFAENVRIDFYLPNCNTFIEFQGEQHYGIQIRPKGMIKRTFEEQLERDSNVRRYASDHNIRLIEIPYTYRNNVEDFLCNYKLA